MKERTTLFTGLVVAILLLCLAILGIQNMVSDAIALPLSMLLVSAWVIYALIMDSMYERQRNERKQQLEAQLEALKKQE